MGNIHHKRLLAEFTGTFILVFCGTGAIIINENTGGVVSHSGVALTFGMVVCSIIYTFGNISGAHFNPAVTISLRAKNIIETSVMLRYILFQIAGAFTASILLKIIFPQSETLGATLPSIPPLKAVIMEFLLTFILMLTILKVAVKEKSILAGLVIGGVVWFEAQFAGPVTGASMNPARSIAPALVSGHLEHLWIYILAPVSGALFANSVDKITESD